MTALVTPLRDGAIDEKAFAELVEAQIAAGIDGLVPCGTTGESATLTAEEQERVIRIAVETARRRVPVVAGAGSSSTAHAIALGRAARKAGADGLLAVTPYYNRPPQEGLYQHFRALVEAVGLPTVVYNVPARTGSDLALETLERLCELQQIVGIKEASGSVVRAQQIVARLGERLVLLCGEDALNHPLFSIGARGCISVVSNVAPALVAESWDAVQAGEPERARLAHAKVLELGEVLFSEPNPIPAKTALSLLGTMSAELRLPLVPMSTAGRERLRAVLVRHGLLR